MASHPYNLLPQGGSFQFGLKMHGWHANRATKCRKKEKMRQDEFAG